jgi:diguanylate cyclase
MLSPDVKADGRSGLANARSGHRAVWLLFGVMGCLLLGYLVWLAVRPASAYSTAVDGWGVDGFEMVAGALCIVGGRRLRPGSVMPLVLGAAVLAWSFGDVALTIESLGGASPASPSPADALYLTFFPLSYVAVVLLVRGETRRLSSPNWLDGAVAGLGASAVCAAFAFSAVLDSTHDSALAAAVNFAYPIGDVLLLLLVIGGTAAMSGRRRTPWLLIAAGLTINVLGDTANLLSSSIGGTHVGLIINAIAWPTSSLLISVAMWLSPGRTDPLATQRPPSFVLPAVAAAAGLAILFIRTLVPINQAATGLATATLVLVVVRTLLSVRELRLQSAVRQQQSVTDHLTGLANRRRLIDALEVVFGDHQAEPRGIAFLFVDLNGFKRVNDAFGHPVGDEVLRQVATRFASALAPNDLLARVGGDEFVALLVDAGAQRAAEVAARLSTSLAEPIQLSAVTAGIGASIGIALAPQDATEWEGLMGCADAAMYRAKLESAPFARYDARLDGGGDKLRLAGELSAAIAAGDLVLHYQPQLELRTGRIIAVEALVRWPHPVHGLIPPAKFLPLAEEAGMMQELTRWVLGEALAECAQWRGRGHELRVSVNVSAGDLAAPDFHETVVELLAGAHLPASSLMLEITETSIIDQFARTKRAVGVLADLGVRISIDDFGAGFTSLAYLSDLPVGEMKLDRRFISSLGSASNGRESEFVRAMIDLGHALGLQVVAEGIEDLSALDLLADLGCDVAQGYAIGRPAPADQVQLAREPAIREAVGTGAAVTGAAAGLLTPGG